MSGAAVRVGTWETSAAVSAGLAGEWGHDSADDYEHEYEGDVARGEVHVGAERAGPRQEGQEWDGSAGASVDERRV